MFALRHPARVLLPLVAAVVTVVFWFAGASSALASTAPPVPAGTVEVWVDAEGDAAAGITTVVVAGDSSVSATPVAGTYGVTSVHPAVTGAVRQVRVAATAAGRADIALTFVAADGTVLGEHRYSNVAIAAETQPTPVIGDEVPSESSPPAAAPPGELADSGMPTVAVALGLGAVVIAIGGVLMARTRRRGAAQ